MVNYVIFIGSRDYNNKALSRLDIPAGDCRGGGGVLDPVRVVISQVVFAPCGCRLGYVLRFISCGYTLGVNYASCGRSPTITWRQIGYQPCEPD